MKVELTIKIDIPERLYRICIALLLAYRRLRFGYTFRKIPLTQNNFAIVDPADYTRLAKFKWRTCKTKGKNTLYAERSIRKPNGRYSRLLMHRAVLSLPAVRLAGLSKGEILRDKLGSYIHAPRGPGAEQRASHLVIDHINRNGLDNRRANLRLATPSQNAANSKKRHPRSGYKGVWLAKNKNRYRAAVWHNNKRHYLGYFSSPTAAARAYDQAARKYHGDFASLNFGD